MKIYPINNLSQNTFQGKFPLNSNLSAKTKQTFEGIAAAGFVSIPMSVYLYLTHIFDKVKGKKNKAV